MQDQQLPKVKSEESQPTSLHTPVCKLKTEAKKRTKIETSSPEAQDSAEQELASPKNHAPDLYDSTKEEAQKAIIVDFSDPVVVEASTLSMRQRAFESSEDPVSLHPKPEKEIGEEEMRQGMGKRFEKFLEEYL